MVPDASHIRRAPPLLGRTAALNAIDGLVRERPGVIAVVGPPGSGTTRVCHEAGARLSGDGYLVIEAADCPAADLFDHVGGALDAARLYREIERAARLRPIVVLAGQRTEADPLGDWTRRLAASRAVILVCARDTTDTIPSVMLEALDRAAIIAIAEHSAPGLDESHGRLVADLALGRPGRAVSLALALRESDPDRIPPVPRDLIDDTTAPLADLPAAAHDVCRWLALFPGGTDSDTLASLCSRHRGAIDDLLELVRAEGLIATGGPPARPTWAFRDPLARIATMHTLSPSQRRLRSAGALADGRRRGSDPELLLDLAVLAQDQDAVVALVPAAARAARRSGNPTAALAATERGLRWCPEQPGARRARILHERGLAQIETARWDDAIESLDRAARESAPDDADELLAIASATSSALWMLGRHDDALDALTGPLEAIAPGDSPARAEALTHAAGVAVGASRFVRGRALADQARALCLRIDDHENATRALIFAGTAETGRSGSPDPDDALARAVAEARTGGAGERNETLACIHQSHAQLLLGDPISAERTARAGHARATERSIDDHRLILAGNLGEALIARGRLAEARRHLDEAAAGWRALGRGDENPAGPGLAQLHLAEGDLRAAAETYEDLSHPGSNTDVFEFAAPVGAGHAWCRIALGDREGATEIIRRHLDLWSMTDDRLAVVDLLLAGVATGGTASDRCRALLDEAVAAGSAAARRAAPIAVAYAHATDSPREAAHRMADAADALDSDGDRWWATFFRFTAGSFAADGIDLLMDARQAFREMGADGWRLRCEGELRSRGRRIPSRADGRPALPHELSARELEVLGEMERGLTNREIGDVLYISERTVARHVSKILAKLEAKNRTSAVRFAREKGLLPGAH